MAQKPVSENTDIPDERSEARNPDPLATGNYTLEMGLKPKLQNNIYDGISIDQFATKKDIQPLEKNIQSLEKNIQSLENDIKSIEKDIKDQKENTDIKFSAVNSRIDSLRNEMNTNFECLKNEMNAKFEKMEAKFESLEAKFVSLEATFVSLRSEMNTKFESLDIKLDGHKKDFQNTMYKSLVLAIGGFAACIAIFQHFFG